VNPAHGTEFERHIGSTIECAAFELLSIRIGPDLSPSVRDSDPGSPKAIPGPHDVSGD
jgi:hypothetical protein